MGRTGEVALDRLRIETELRPDIKPHLLLTGDSQGHGDTLEGHPVDKPLPVSPLPVRHTVAEGAVVEEEPLRHNCRSLKRTLGIGETIGQLHLIIGVRAYIGMTVLAEVPIEPHREGKGITSLDRHLTSLSNNAVPRRRVR